MESGKGGKGSPTLFIAFVFVEGFISKYLRVTFTANGKLRYSYKNSSNNSYLLITDFRAVKMNSKRQVKENLGHVVHIHDCRLP